MAISKKTGASVLKINTPAAKPTTPTHTSRRFRVRALVCELYMSNA